MQRRVNHSDSEGPDQCGGREGRRRIRASAHVCVGRGGLCKQVHSGSERDERQRQLQQLHSTRQPRPTRRRGTGTHTHNAHALGSAILAHARAHFYVRRTRTHVRSGRPVRADQKKLPPEEVVWCALHAARSLLCALHVACCALRAVRRVLAGGPAASAAVRAQRAQRTCSAPPQTLRSMSALLPARASVRSCACVRERVRARTRACVNA
jgi:hypothetical protein